MEKVIKSANKRFTIEVDGKIYKKEQTIFDKSDPRSVSRTQQHFKKETNINSILKKYKKSGLLTDPLIKPTVYPQFGDFTDVVDFQTMKNKMIQVQNYFNSLPVEIRNKFGNDPHNLMEFMNNDENKEEAIKLGLIGRDLSKLKYVKKVNGQEVDITNEVIANRGLFVDGQRVNKDGTLYIEVNDANPGEGPVVEGQEPTQ